MSLFKISNFYNFYYHTIKILIVKIIYQHANKKLLKKTKITLCELFSKIVLNCAKITKKLLK
jgi:hypothetical protein